MQVEDDFETTGASGGYSESPNYPADYNNYDNCEVSIDGEGVLHSMSFHLEKDWDYFYVGPTAYSGREGPNGHE
eukprot:gene22982-27797_t